jgi:hypothetical protein
LVGGVGGVGGIRGEERRGGKGIGMLCYEDGMRDGWMDGWFREGMGGGET